MSSADDYILVTGSRNLNDDGIEPDTTSEAEDNASLQTFEKQGISILEEEERTAKGEPLDQLSQELLNEGGIEIVSEDGDELYL